MSVFWLVLTWSIIVPNLKPIALAILDYEKFEMIRTSRGFSASHAHLGVPRTPPVRTGRCQCVHQIWCVWRQGSRRYYRGYENLNVSHVTQATPHLGINVSFLASTGLINNCAKCEACSFNRCEDRPESPKKYHLHFAENVKNLCEATPRRWRDVCTAVAVWYGNHRHTPC